MPRRTVRQLRGGETEHLTQNYWAIKGITLSNDSTDEDLYDAKCKYLPLFNEDELAYSYWEFVHLFTRSKQTKERVRLMREYILTEFMDRKYKRNAYKEEEYAADINQ